MNDSFSQNDRSSRKNRSLRVLAIFAILSSIIYAIILFLSSRFSYGSEGTERPIIAVLVLFTAAFIINLIAVRFATKAAQNRKLLTVIVGSAIVFRLLLLFSTPIQEVDIYRYLWDGAVCEEGVNPFDYSPIRVRNAEVHSTHDQQLQKLIRLRNRNFPIAEILNRVHQDDLPTIYPAVSQVVFFLVAVATPPQATVVERVFFMKCWLTGFDLATLFLVIALLNLCGKPVGLCILYAWCPLLIKEVANSGHLDSIAVFLTTLAVYSFVKLLKSSQSVSSRNSSSRTTFTITTIFLVLALAIGAKLYAVILVPLFFFFILKNFGWQRTIVPMSALILTSSILMWPMLAKRTDPITPTAQSKLPIPTMEETEPSEGLRTFLQTWEMNDFLFLIIIENIRPTEKLNPDKVAWFSVMPEGMRGVLVELVTSRFAIAENEAPFLLTRAMTSLVFLVVAIILAWRASIKNSISLFCETAFLTLAWFWLLCPTQNPWYWVWALPLLPFARSRVWWGVAGIAMIYYLRFWFGYHWPSSNVLNTRYHGKLFFDFVVTWIEFAPWFAVLACTWLYGTRKRTGVITPKINPSELLAPENTS